MDKKDRKAGMKRKSKAVDPMLGIEDDELIGSLLKKKGKKTFKKSKIAGDGGQGRVAEVKAADVKDDGLGEMDDTLANFRKKLRAPKNIGSAAVKHEKCLSKDSLSVPSKSLDELIKPLDRDLMPQGKGGVLNGEGGECGDLTQAESLKVKDTRKDQIFKVKSDAMIIESKSNCDLDSTSTVGDALQNQKDTSKPDDKSSEDSLSVFFQKVQSEMSGKCVRSKLEKENQISEDASKRDFSAVSETRVDVFEPCSQLLGRPLEPDENGHADPVQVSINSSLIRPDVSDCLRACSGKIAGDVESVINSGAVGNNRNPQNDEVFLMEVKGLDPSTSMSKDVQENLDSEKLECGVNSELGLHRTAELQHSLSPSAVNNQQCGSAAVLDTCIEERIQAPISSQDMEDLSSKYRSSPVSVNENLKCEEAKSTENEDVSVQVGNGSNNVMQPPHQLEDACPSRSEYASEDEALNVKSHSSAMLDHQASCPEDVESPSDLEIKGNGQNQRASRVAKRHRHVDMAYEGDVDWEVLMQEQELFSIHQNSDKTKDKFSSVTSVTDAEKRKMAAVSVGLKARAVTPMEKIKFKEVLKHKGGLQEYLECRNYILSLWNKDVTRILHLSDFGVSASPLDDESPRTSLIRDTFNFLDKRGYINFGVPSRKDKVENCIKDDLKFHTDEKCVENSRRSLVDAGDDHVPLTMGKETNLEHCVTGKSDHAFDVGEQAAKSISDDGPLDPETPASAATIAPEVFPADGTLEIKFHDPETPGEAVNNSHLDSKPCFIDEDERMAPAISLGMPPAEEAVADVTSEPLKPVSAPMSAPAKFSEIDTKFDSGPRKSVLIVGAGPAGLTAARHMQRQGFDVTVLEARNRIGGRVFTDRSSLSVPVDLGASIITGVEADVATERRPDPSALICGQLGLEMTVLNSDCPLYDTVTGQKVPADLDEALEAEYNDLLDEMELLVAEKGQRAMKMSLEEGLELGLKRHRLPQSGQDAGDIRPVKSADSLAQAETVCVDNEFPDAVNIKAEVLSPLERRVMDWHFAHLEYGCASMLKEVSLVDWNQDDIYGGFGGAHCMIKGGYSALVESLGEGLCIHFDHVVTEIEYNMDSERNGEMHKKVKVSTSNGREFHGDAVLVTVPLGCLKAETIKFSPSLPEWKHSSIRRLGFGVLNKVILEFPEVFWDDTIDYFGATAEDSDKRGRCFMFWNIKKTVGAPVLIALLVGKAAIDGQSINSADHVNHALFVLRKLFGEDKVCDPIASVVTDWGRDPYSYGAYSYVAVGSSGEDYDIIGRPVENCLFFAGEATCKEHPDTVGGAMMSGLREAVRIIDIFDTGIDYTAEVEAMEAAKRRLDLARSEVKDIIRRLDAVEFSIVSFKKSLDRSQISAWSLMIKDMFFTAKTTAGRLHLAKELLHLPVGFLKSFASTKQGLSTLNSWILDSLGKDGTQLLRHCVRLLVRVSNDLVSVRLSGIGKTVREKVCVHTSRDIRAIASQLVHVWVELFRKEKAMKAKRRLTLKQASPAAGRPPLGTHLVDNTESSKSSGSSGHQKLSYEIPMTEEEKAAFAAAEAARAAAIAAAEAYAASGAMHNASLQAPKILSFQKFTMREQSTYMDETDYRKNWSGAPIIGQDCLAEIDSRNCRVRDWSVDFTAAGINLENSKISIDNHSQRSHHSNDVADNQMSMKFREHSEENLAFDSSILTKAWVDSAGSMGIKDYSAIERWQCQAMAASSQFPPRTTQVRDEENSTSSAKVNERQHYTRAKESAAPRPTVSKESKGNQHQRRGPASIKEAVVDYVASLLMPLYKAKKLDRDDYKSIMKKTATKVMEHATDTEKAMAVYQFLDFKRKNKIRDFVDVLIERHMGRKQDPKPGNSGRL